VTHSKGEQHAGAGFLDILRTGRDRCSPPRLIPLRNQNSSLAAKVEMKGRLKPSSRSASAKNGLCGLRDAIKPASERRRRMLIQQTFQKAFQPLNQFKGILLLDLVNTDRKSRSLMLGVEVVRCARIPSTIQATTGRWRHTVTLDASPDPETSYLRAERVEILAVRRLGTQPACF